MSESKTSPQLWAIITVAVAIIACLGTIVAAIIDKIPVPIPQVSTPVPVFEFPTEMQISTATEILVPTETLTSTPVPTLGADMYSVSIPSAIFKMGGDGGVDVSLGDYIIDKQVVTNSMFAVYLNANKDKFYPLGDAVSDQIYTITGDGSLDKWIYTLVCNGCTDWKDRIHWDGTNFILLEGYENSPVVNITWHGAIAYCTWKNKGLPTEAQWEYAAQVGYITLESDFQEWTSTLFINAIFPYATNDGRENPLVDGDRIIRNTSDMYSRGNANPNYTETINLGFRCAKSTQ
jgi:formylglycine-generating enzyme required for sulfatase activity